MQADIFPKNDGVRVDNKDVIVGAKDLLDKGKLCPCDREPASHLGELQLIWYKQVVAPGAGVALLVANSEVAYVRLHEVVDNHGDADFGERALRARHFALERGARRLPWVRGAGAAAVAVVPEPTDIARGHKVGRVDRHDKYEDKG